MCLETRNDNITICLLCHCSVDADVIVCCVMPSAVASKILLTSYITAAESTTQHPHVSTFQQDGVGAKIAEKIDEFLQTGKLRKLEKVSLWVWEVWVGANLNT